MFSVSIDSVWRFFRSAVLLVLLVVSSLSVCAARTAPWPQGNSDLTPDPSILFGTLDNGMHYAIQHCATPTGQVAMRLVILAGSMNEAKGEEGVAHLLEHMAFHASTHHPDGDVELKLQRLGLRIGPDLNGLTFKNATLYKLDLHANDNDAIDTGLDLFREIGGELLLDPAAIARERRIVTAEIHSRTTALTGVVERQSAELFADHPLAHEPVGRVSVVETVPPERVRDFYNAFYRPERAILIVVGDVEPREIEDKIKGDFRSWRGKGVAGVDPAPMSDARQGAQFAVAAISGLASQGLQIFYLHAGHTSAHDRAETAERLVESIAIQAAQQRLTALNETAGRPFAAGAFLSTMQNAQMGQIDFSNASYVSDWRASLKLLVEARLQVLQFGLTKKEIAAAIDSQRSLLDTQVNQSASLTSTVRADALFGAVVIGLVPRSPQQALELFGDTAAHLTPERANDVLRAHLTADRVVVFYSTPAPTDVTEASLRDAFDDASTAPIEPYNPPETLAWKSFDFGPPGKVAEQRSIDNLGVTMVRFDNGVRLTIKPTTFGKDQVALVVRFGHGRLDLPKDKLAASDLGPDVLALGGFRDMSLTEAGRALMGKGVGISANLGEDAFTLSPSAFPPLQTKDLDLETQVLATKIAAPGWRTDYWQSIVAAQARSDDSLDASPAAVYASRVPALIHPGDMRWVPSTAQMRAAWKPEDAVAFIKPILESSPLEIIVVGDVSVEHAVDSVAKTFGALPPRLEKPEPVGLRTVTFPPPTREPLTLYHTGPAYQAAAAVIWPTTDALANARDTQAARVLAEIMRVRAFDQIRGKEGDAYSPSVSASFSLDLPGYGGIVAFAQVEPAETRKTLAELSAIAADVATKDVSADEFARSQHALIDAEIKQQQQNGYWLVYLVGAQTDGRRLQYAAQAIANLKSLTPADIQAAARRWLRKERSWQCLILPRPQ